MRRIGIKYLWIVPVYAISAFLPVLILGGPVYAIGAVLAALYYGIVWLLILIAILNIFREFIYISKDNRETIVLSEIAIPAVLCLVHWLVFNPDYWMIYPSFIIAIILFIIIREALKMYRS